MDSPITWNSLITYGLLFSLVGTLSLLVLWFLIGSVLWLGDRRDKKNKPVRSWIDEEDPE